MFERQERAIARQVHDSLASDFRLVWEHLHEWHERNMRITADEWDDTCEAMAHISEALFDKSHPDMPDPSREAYPHQCQKCGDAGMHYPSHCHTQGEGYTCCECLGHGYVPTPSGYVCKQLKAEQDSREGETLADMTSGHASIVNMEDFECFGEA